jgi:ribosomal protein L29
LEGIPEVDAKRGVLEIAGNKLPLKTKFVKSSNMKSKDFVTKTKDELVRMMEKRRRGLKKSRFKNVSGGIKNTKELREDKKDIARIFDYIKLKI